jgi:glycosyltransferase involved in cell wall biosynthesis
MSSVTSSLVSVVIPTYNRAHLVGRALESLFAQTHSDWEAIIVDDGSRDDTVGVVEKIAARDERIRLFKHAKNSGAQAARNTGIRSARGPWVAFLDVDDWYLPESIALRMRAAERSAVPVVHSEGLLLRSTGGVPQPWGAKPLAGDVYRELLSASAMLFPTLLVRRDTLAAIGGLDEGLSAFQEWDLSIRLARVARFAFVAEPTFVYDFTHGDSISKNPGRSGRGYERIVRTHLAAMARLRGPRILSRHFLAAAGYYEEGGLARDALRCKLAAAVLWPPNIAKSAARRLLRAVR